MICDFLIFMKQTSSSGNENSSAVSPMVGDGTGASERQFRESTVRARMFNKFFNQYFFVFSKEIYVEPRVVKGNTT